MSDKGIIHIRLPDGQETEIQFTPKMETFEEWKRQMDAMNASMRDYFWHRTGRPNPLAPSGGNT